MYLVEVYNETSVLTKDEIQILEENMVEYFILERVIPEEEDY